MDTRTFTPTGDLPEALTERPQWICWKYQANGSDKPRKVPCTPNGGALNEWQKNPAQWLSHDDAVAAYQANNNLAGIGFVLTPDTGITGVDMDSAIDPGTGEMADWARAHLADFDTYAEVSPSRAGLRLFVEGNLPDGCPKKSGHREIYDSGRWLTVTGKTLSDEPVNACPDAVSRYLAAMQPDGKKAPENSAQAATGDIHEGDRNTRLTSLAGWLRMGGLSQLELDAALQAANVNRCKPPLSVDEVAGIARSVARYEATTDATQGEASITETMPLMECGDLTTATRPPVECVMEPYFPRRQVTLFGGHGGSGKSYLGLVFAAHLATGTAWAGHGCTQGRVLFVSLEDEPDLNRWRLANICTVYGLDADAVAGNIAFMDGTATAATFVVETGNGKHLEETAAWRDVRANAQGFDTVIVDNASDAFTANVNDPALVRVFLRKLQTLARQTNAACLLLAHIDKASARHGASGNSYIGTAAWHNTVRSRIALVTDNGSLTLEHEKHNLTMGADTLHMRKAEHGVPVPMSQADIMHDTRAADALLAKQDAPEVLALIQAAIDNGEAVNPSRKANATAWHVLKNYGLPSKYDSRQGKQRFWRAVDWLYQHKRIANIEYKTSDYKVRMKMQVLADMVAENPPAEA